MKVPDNSILDIWTIEFESGASDFPPEGPKKRSSVEKDTFKKLKIRPRDLRIRIEGVRLPPRGSEKKEFCRKGHVQKIEN